jgi:hypothetical protein
MIGARGEQARLSAWHAGPFQLPFLYDCWMWSCNGETHLSSSLRDCSGPCEGLPACRFKSADVRRMCYYKLNHVSESMVSHVVSVLVPNWSKQGIIEVCTLECSTVADVHREA